MDGSLVFVVIGCIFFFSIIYYIVRGAVEDGTLNALLKFENMKNQQNENKYNEK